MKHILLIENRKIPKGCFYVQICTIDAVDAPPTTITLLLTDQDPCI